MSQGGVCRLNEIIHQEHKIQCMPCDYYCHSYGDPLVCLHPDPRPQLFHYTTAELSVCGMLLFFSPSIAKYIAYLSIAVGWIPHSLIWMDMCLACAVNMKPELQVNFSLCIPLCPSKCDRTWVCLFSVHRLPRAMLSPFPSRNWCNLHGSSYTANYFPLLPFPPPTLQCSCFPPQPAPPIIFILSSQGRGGEKKSWVQKRIDLLFSPSSFQGCWPVTVSLWSRGHCAALPLLSQMPWSLGFVTIHLCRLW